MNHESIWRAIECFAADNKMSCSGLAKASGLDPTTFNKSKRLSRDGKPRWPSTQSLAKIFESTGSNFSDLAKYIPKDFPTENER